MFAHKAKNGNSLLGSGSLRFCSRLGRSVHILSLSLSLCSLQERDGIIAIFGLVFNVHLNSRRMYGFFSSTSLQKSVISALGESQISKPYWESQCLPQTL